ncbi:hypothetical protein MKX01_037470 [Papaver californicum]|nr:hypothetical protein MKX01_037470 [Papaver californicum]
MSEPVEYRCFIGGLSWSTSDRGLKNVFGKYGNLVEAKVMVDKFSGRSRGFGFLIFDDKKAMDEAIDVMNGMDLDGRPITVGKAQPRRHGDRNHHDDSNRSAGAREGSAERRAKIDKMYIHGDRKVWQRIVKDGSNTSWRSTTCWLLEKAHTWV